MEKLSPECRVNKQKIELIKLCGNKRVSISKRLFGFRFFFFRVMLFLFTLPLLQVILFRLSIGRDPTELRLLIVNHEVNPFTSASHCQNLPPVSKCSLSNLSCRYLSHLNNTIFQVSNLLPSNLDCLPCKLNGTFLFQESYPTPETAVAFVQRGGAYGVLYFTENFTDALVARMALGRDADEETLDQSEVRVWLDMSSELMTPT